MPPQKTFNLLQVFKKSFSLFTDLIDKGHPTTKYVRSVLAALKTIYLFGCLQLGELWSTAFLFLGLLYFYQTLWAFLCQVLFVKSFVYVIHAVNSCSHHRHHLDHYHHYDHISLIIAPKFGGFLLRIDSIVMTILAVTLSSWQSFIRLDKEEVFSIA